MAVGLLQIGKVGGARGTGKMQLGREEHLQHGKSLMLEALGQNENSRQWQTEMNGANKRFPSFQII